MTSSYSWLKIRKKKRMWRKGRRKAGEPYVDFMANYTNQFARLFVKFVSFQRENKRYPKVEELSKDEIELVMAYGGIEHVKRKIRRWKRGLKKLGEDGKLLLRVKLGDKIAENKLINKHIRLAAHVAARCCGSLDFEEKIQLGRIGLMKAIRKFDFSLNVCFSTYATEWIKHEVIHASKMDQRIHIPLSILNLKSRINEIILHLRGDLGREPTQDEILEALVEETDISEDKAETILEIPTVISGDKCVGDEEDTPIFDFISSKEEPHDIVLSYRDICDKLLRLLNEKEREVIELRYGFRKEGPMTLEEVGRILGVTRERVRQIEERALRKIRLSPYAHRLLEL